ncbi:hypothetical protein RJ639_038509 [Escallonia herrerae]|uniref:mitogen-activated protein kinase kinase n=1 Tax=Escallonia herrerae TaxID=1293975 RepID=A0AA88WL66_9ASTE|nr:hypothetical protein RJ639_038509 [Escallonia herrerae]
MADTIEECDSCVGTCAYMSPERVDPERWDGDYSDGFAGDVWSLGVVILQCHVGCFPLIPPGQKADWVTLVFAICLGEKMAMPESASPEFHDFVRRCLAKDWRKRGTVEELLNHPFVTRCSSVNYMYNLGSILIIRNLYISGYLAIRIQQYAASSNLR